MKNSTKNILATIPLIVGLAGPAAAALSESDNTGDRQETPHAIDSLLGRYSGLIPGGHDQREADDQNVPPSQQLSGFTEASSPMSSYYMVQGGERRASNQDNHGSRSHSGDASAPAALSHTVHSSSESLGAVAGGISPSRADGGSYRTDAAEVIRAHEVKPGTGTPDTPHIEPPIIPTTPVPLPAAVVLLGSGLAALAPLRKRKQADPV